MANTYTLIQSISVTSGTLASADFTSIPTDGTYTDLEVRISARTNGTGPGDGLDVKFNNNGSNFGGTFLFFNHNAVGAMNAYGVLTGSGYGGNATADANTAGAFSNVYIYIPNYANSSYTKTLYLESFEPNYATGTNTAYDFIYAQRWDDTSAVNRITFTPTGSFVQGSIISLYGIKSL